MQGQNSCTCFLTLYRLCYVSTRWGCIFANKNDMAKINIPFKGMGNVPDDGAARDGELLVGINVRHEGGEIVQRNNPARKSYGNVGEIYYHGSNGHLIAITEDGMGLKDITAEKVLDLQVKRAATVAELNERLGTVPTPGLWDKSEVVEAEGFKFTYYTGSLTASGLLTVSGSGEVPNIETWRQWEVRFIKIEEGVTSIGESAFADCAALEKIAIPDGVTKIETNAFKGCTNLEFVVLPGSVTEIAAGAFDDTVVYITSSEPPTLGENALRKCVIPYGKMLIYSEWGHIEVVEDEGVAHGFETKIDKVSLMGNIVKIESGGVLYYAIWKNEEYVFLGELPGNMEVGYSVKHYIDTLVTKDKYYGNAFGHNYENSWTHVAGGFFDELLYILYDKKRYIDSAMFVVAAKLFDGTYIQLSPIGMVEDKRDSIYVSRWLFNGYIGGKANNFKRSEIGLKESNYGEVALASMGINVNLPGYDFEKWEDIIMSIDVFTSGSIMYHAKKELSIQEMTEVDYGITYRYVAKTVAYSKVPLSDIVNNVANALFYKIASYDLKGNLISVIENTSPSNIAVQTRLENVVPFYEISGDKIKNYNSREHLAGVTKRYKAGGISVPNDRCASRNYVYKTENLGRVTVVTHIHTANKLLKVKEVIENVKITRAHFVLQDGGTAKNRYGCLSPLLSYPDIRAIKMEFFIEGRGKKGDEDYIPKTYKAFGLKPGGIGAYAVNRYINESEVGLKADIADGIISLKQETFATFLQENIEEFNILENRSFTLEKEKEQWQLTFNDKSYTIDNLKEIGITIYKIENSVAIDVTDTYSDKIEVYYTPAGQILEYGELRPLVLIDFEADGMEYEIPEADNEEKDDDILYVSETDNPFYYPYTYKFGSPIVAMESSAEEVSAGQFGQYPMNVFTNEGIWALGVDTTGKGAYAMQTPLSREVCSGKTCTIVGGVAFPTMNGVKILQGSDVVDITATMMGESNIIPGIADRIAEGMKLQMPGMRFGNFLKYAKVAYDYTTNEVVLYKDHQDVMYRYGVSTGMWTMENNSFDAVIPAYPQLLTVKSERGGKVVYTYDNTPESERPSDVSALPVDIMLFTRPMRLGMFGRKRVSQVALRGTWSGTVSLYVLGSNDGKEYRVIAGKENVGGELHRDVVTRFCRSGSYEYIAVCVTGKNFEGRLTGVEMIAEPGIGQNRLR